MNILILGTDWYFSFSRSQQIAKELSKNHNVTYLSTTQSHIRRISDLPQFFIHCQRWFSTKINSNLKIIPPRNWVPHRNSVSDLIANLTKLIPFDLYLKANRIDFDLVIATLPMDISIARKIQHKFLCYDCSDDNIHLHGSNKLRELEIQFEEENLLKNSTFIIVSGKRLYKQVKLVHKNVFFIPNGVDFEHFIGATKLASVPKDMVKIVSGKKPIVGFMGVIQKWVDTSLIANLAMNCKNLNFVLIGTVATNTDSLKKLSNIYLLGAKQYEMLPNYLSTFDVGIIPFKINELTLAADPIKLYEYFAAGLPVVSVALPEVVKKGPLVNIATTPDKFVKQIYECITNDSSNLKKARIAYAKQNSWASRATKLKEIINRFVK